MATLDSFTTLKDQGVDATSFGHHFQYVEQYLRRHHSTQPSHQSYNNIFHTWALLHQNSTCSSSSLLFWFFHFAMISNFPHTKLSKQGTVGSMPQNRWYDEDCKDLYRQHKELQKMTRRKKQVWEAPQYWKLYHMLMCSLCTTNQHPLRIQDHTWHVYTNKLYQVLNQPPIRMPSTPRPTMETFFKTS